MTERRYSDSEIAAIFRAATDDPQQLPHEVPGEEGLSLVELQAIGREVGIAPEAVAQAAQALDVRLDAQSRTFLGLPVGVARTVNLNRRLSDEEWERLVVQLREVFNARGVTRSDGSLRQWTNGNLQVLLEPTDTGHRLRFATLHGGASASIRTGLIALGVSGIVALMTSFGGHLGDSVVGIGFLGLVGLGMIASGALRLPGWAKLRARQMEAIATRIALPPGTTSPPTKSLPPDSQSG